jgi:hypothetical protein
VPTPLTDGLHTWGVESIDSVGNVTASAVGNFGVDTTGPTGVTAVSPVDLGSIAEGSTTYDWSPGTDAGSGIASYDILVDGVVQATCGAGPCPAATNIPFGTDNWGSYATYAGAHTWRIVARDALGNVSNFDFSFTANAVPDVTPPAGFNLLSPANGAALAAGSSLTWEPAWDFVGIDHYDVFIDGASLTSVPGTQTFYTPSSATGTLVWLDTLDPPLNTWTPGAPWTIGAHPSNMGGDSLGFAPVDLAATTRYATVDLGTIPASGGFVEAFVRHDTHAQYDGVTWQLSLNGGPWWNTCNVNSVNEGATVGTVSVCPGPATGRPKGMDIVDPVGGYTDELSGHSGNPLKYLETYTGDNGSMKKTKLYLQQFAGQNVRLRLAAGWDNWRTTSSPPSQDMSFYIDDLRLLSGTIAPGSHAWKIDAVDASGNRTSSIQTWNVML